MRTFIFGYGSLITPDGINGRGMSRQYGIADLKPARLRDHRRAWEAVTLHGSMHGLLFLGIHPRAGHATNGVIFEISDYDLGPFLISECSGPAYRDPVYDLIDVTEHMESAPKNSRILTCITSSPSQDGLVAPYYQRIIARCMEAWGSEFKREFIDSTDWSTFRPNLNDRNHTVIPELREIISRS